MVLHESHPTIYEQVRLRGESIAEVGLSTAAAAQRHASLYRRAEAARWAIVELGADPRLALSCAVWPKAGVGSFAQSA